MKRKSIFKSLFAAAMALIMIFGAAPLSGFVGIRLPMLSLKAEAETTEDGLFEYAVDRRWTESGYQDGVRITRCDKNVSGKVVIPEAIEGYEVKWISSYAFSSCKNITEITMPDSVTEIGEWAFSNCKNLTEITIPDGVTEIGDSAFLGCKRLAEITIPDSVTEIGGGAFSNCTSLSKVKLPNSLTKIGYSAFSDCKRLTEITIPDSVTEIGNYAFDRCTSLSKVQLSNGLIKIGDYAFGYCKSLAEITIPDSVTEIGGGAFSRCSSLVDITVSPDNKNCVSVDGVLFSKDMSILLAYPAGNNRSTYIVPDSVTEIGNSAFSGCTSLKELTIPDSVTEIGRSAFKGCINLTDITVSPDNKNFSSVDGVLFSKDMSTLLVYPAGNKRSTYIVPDDVTKIGNYAFDRCTSLSKVQLPNGLTKIGDDAFSDCKSLTEITMPDSVTEIGSFAFYRCTSLSKVKLSNGLTEIGSFAFSDCKRLAEMTIPDSVTEIGKSVFSGCSSLVEITVSPDNKNYVSVDGVLFSKDMSALLAYPAGNKRSTYTVPDSVTKIDDAAFFGCVYLTDITVSSDNKNYVSVDGVLFTKNMSTLVAYPAGNERSTYTIPYGVKKICVFAYCENLKEIVFPDSIIDVSSELFIVGCYSFTNITVSPGKKMLSSSDGVLFAIDGRELIKYPAANERSTYTIPDGVEIIYPEAFAHSKNLKSVTISESVTEIYESAFMCCTSLREITIPKSVVEIETSAFENCDSLKNVYYLGTRAQWKAVVIGTKNEALTRATVHCIDDPPCDHVWGEWEVVEEATYEKEGLERRACSRCNIEETRVIPKLVRASAIELSESEKTVFVGDTFTITATVKPEDAFNRTVTWSSSDPSIATVDENGTVTAIAKGEAIITAESADGVKAECKVTVEKKDGFFKTLLKIITAPFRAIIYLFKKLFGK